MSKLGKQLLKSLKHIHKTEYEKRTGKRAWSYDFYNIWVAAQETLFYSWWNHVNVFLEFLERVWLWLPILWRDRNWDHSFILDVLEHKIKLTRLCIGKYDRHTTVKEDCHNMRVAEILIRRIREDNYDEPFMVEHEAKWGKLDWNRWHKEEHDNILFDNKFSKAGLTRPGIKSQKDWDEENKEHLRIIKHSKYQKSQDYDYLFKHLKKHLERWWD